MSDAKYFQKGKVQEFRQELVEDVKKDPKHTKKRTVLKKIVANMTMGNDMSPLFPDIISCMQISDLEIKKMVYLYLINYAKSKPDMVLMAVNSFLKDAADSNPLIRALAIRTMSYIHVDKVIDCICEPLRLCIKDRDPYVRKTAAICVPKVYFYNRELAVSEGLLTALRSLLSDSNSTVVANAIISMFEIDAKSDDFNFTISSGQVSTLVTAMNECSEWGQTYILESLMLYVPKQNSDATTLIDRLVPRLQHANSGVVLTTIKVLMYLMTFDHDEAHIANVFKKMTPPLGINDLNFLPLVTLTSAEPEIQYVALKNILLILQKRPDLLQTEMKVFFCKYNDPIYVKLSKLEILFRLANEQNVNLMLAELKEYAAEVDVDFVRKAVRSIGRCAIKIESSANKCMEALVELIQTKVNYVVQEAVIVIRDIFRKYPNKYESIIGILCENLDGLDEPEAKSSMIWIVGQYADRIENSHELLEGFIEAFLEEPSEVQLSILTAGVKLFAKKPLEGKPLVLKLLKWATDETDNPDVRDRGFFYWRLLSNNPMAVKDILFSDRPPISTETDNLDPELLNQLLPHLNTLVSIYYRPPRALFPHYKDRKTSYASSERIENQKSISAAQSYNPYGNNDNYNMNRQLARQPNLLDVDEPEPEVAPNSTGGFYANDYNQFSVPAQITAPQASIPDNVMDQLGQLGLGSSIGNQIIGAPLSFPKQVILPANIAKGLEILGTFSRRQGQMLMEMTFTNKALTPLFDFAIQFNKNTFGLLPGSPLQVRSPLPPNQSAETSLLIGFNPTTHAQPSVPLNNLQVAIKNNVGIFFFQTLVPYHILFREDGKVTQNDFLSAWQQTESTSNTITVDSLSFMNIDSLRGKLSLNNVFVVAERQIENKYALYLSTKSIDGTVFLTEINAPTGPNGSITILNAVVRSSNDALIPLYLESLESILKSR